MALSADAMNKSARTFLNMSLAMDVAEGGRFCMDLKEQEMFEKIQKMIDKTFVEILDLVVAQAEDGSAKKDEPLPIQALF